MITKFSTSSISNRIDYDSMLAGNSAYYPSDYEWISTTLVSSSTATVTFSSIPQTYKHLQVRATVNGGSASEIQVKYNGLATTFQDHTMGTNSTATSAGNAYVYTYIRGFESGSDANNFAAGILDILDYTNANKRSVVRMLTGYSLNSSNNQLNMRSGFNPTSIGAITTLAFTHGANFNAGTRFSLYGILG